MLYLCILIFIYLLGIPKICSITSYAWINIMFLGTKKMLEQLSEVACLVGDPRIIMGWDRIVFNLYIHQENIPNILMSIFQERSYLELMIFQLRCSGKILAEKNFVRRCTINTKLSLMEEPHHGLDLLFFCMVMLSHL